MGTWLRQIGRGRRPRRGCLIHGSSGHKRLALLHGRLVWRERLVWRGRLISRRAHRLDGAVALQRCLGGPWHPIAHGWRLRRCRVGCEGRRSGLLRLGLVACRGPVDHLEVHVGLAGRDGYLGGGRTLEGGHIRRLLPTMGRLRDGLGGRGRGRVLTTPGATKRALLTVALAFLGRAFARCP